MRKQSSLFNRVCEFVNNKSSIGTYKTPELIDYCGHYEMATGWKRDPYYRTRSYQTMLKNCGFVKNVKRGQWEVIRPIPDWFDLGHVGILLGYHKYYQDENKNFIDIKTYKGMDKQAIKDALDNSYKPKPKPQVMRQLPALRKTNQEVYRKVVNYIKEKGISKFNTQNELGAFIETIKWPYTENDGSKPKYSIKGNYSPIIDHLVRNKILSKRCNGKYRIEYTVIQNDSNAPVSTAVVAAQKISKIVENYDKVLNKIDNQNGTKELDNSKNTMDNSQKIKKIDEVTDLTKNIAFLETAFDAIGNCSSNDSFMRARLYHLQVQIQDLTSAFDDKRNFILNSTI